MVAPKFCGKPSCSNKVRGRTYCPEHTPEPWSGGRGSTRQGRKLRAQVLTEEPVCRDCRVQPSTEAGHITPYAQGGTYTRPNLKGQCRSCNLAQMYADKRSSSMPRR